MPPACEGGSGVEGWRGTFHKGGTVSENRKKSGAARAGGGGGRRKGRMWGREAGRASQAGRVGSTLESWLHLPQLNISLPMSQ